MSIFQAGKLLTGKYRDSPQPSIHCVSYSDDLWKQKVGALLPALPSPKAAPAEETAAPQGELERGVVTEKEEKGHCLSQETKASASVLLDTNRKQS